MTVEFSGYIGQVTWQFGGSDYCYSVRRDDSEHYVTVFREGPIRVPSQQAQGSFHRKREEKIFSTAEEAYQYSKKILSEAKHVKDDEYLFEGFFDRHWIIKESTNENER